MQDATKACLGLAAAALLGSLYVLVHERRRKLKKEKRKSQSGSGANGGALTKEKLIRILGQSSAAAYQLIEQTRKMVYAKHEQTGIPLDKCVEELQQNFENAMEAVEQTPTRPAEDRPCACRGAWRGSAGRVPSWIRAR